MTDYGERHPDSLAGDLSDRSDYPEPSALDGAGNLRLLYYGPSMYPTLRPADVLYITPYGGEEIRAGDVVVFVRPEGARAVAHRVASVDEAGIATRGDHNLHVDSGRIGREHIVGRVTSVQRGNGLIKVRGGFAGLAQAAACRYRQRILKIGKSALRPFYDLLIRSRALRKLPIPFTRPRVVSFLKGNGEELHLMVGTRTVGWLRPGDEKWRIRLVYRPFIDEATLPRHPDNL